MRADARPAPPGSTPSAATTGRAAAPTAQAIAAAAASRDTVPVDSLALRLPGDRAVPGRRPDDELSPRTSRTRDSNPDTIPLTFFRKASGSISGPFDDVVRPAHVRLLDYEVEIGLVIGRELPVGTDGHRGQPGRLRRRPGGHQRRLRPRRATAQDPVLRVQVLPDLHPGRARRWCCWTPTSSSGSATCGCGCGSTARCGRTAPSRDMIYPPVAGAARADPVPAAGPRRPAADRHPGRHRAERTAQARRDPRRAAAARDQVEAVLQAPGAATRKYLQDGDVIEAARRHRRRRDRPRHPAHRS